MRRLALWLEYDGGRFQGFQRLSRRGQESGTRGNPHLWPAGQTIQEELERKLGLILGEPIIVHGSGRTDRGVHATGQVVAFDTETENDEETILRSLNAVLCEGLRAWRTQWVPPGFHPRFSALERVYHYYLWPQGPRHSAFFRRLCWIVDQPLDLEGMDRAAKNLLGSHDFSAYCKSPERSNESRVRELRAIQIQRPALQPALALGPWAELHEMVCLEVRANAFLRRMVRLLVANLVEVGRGRWPEDRPRQVLESRDPTLNASPAPPQGLFLVHIEYVLPSFPPGGRHITP